MAVKSFQKLVETVLSTLEQDPGRYWSQDELVKKVSERVQYSADPFIIATCIKSLVVCGRVKGWLRGTQVVKVAYKPEQDSGDMVPKAELVKVMEAVKRQYDSKLGEMKAELVKALDLVIEAELRRIEEQVEHTKGC